MSFDQIVSPFKYGIAKCKTKHIDDVNIIFFSIGLNCLAKNMYDAPPSPLMNSNVSLKVKIAKGKGIGVRSLARNTSGVEGLVGARGWD
jgi:hypothetical protein